MLQTKNSKCSFGCLFLGTLHINLTFTEWSIISKVFFYILGVHDIAQFLVRQNECLCPVITSSLYKVLYMLEYLTRILSKDLTHFDNCVYSVFGETQESTKRFDYIVYTGYSHSRQFLVCSDSWCFVCIVILDHWRNWLRILSPTLQIRYLWTLPSLLLEIHACSTYC